MTILKKLFGHNNPLKMCEHTVKCEIEKAELNLKVYRKNLMPHVVEIITGTRPDMFHHCLRSLELGVSDLIEEKIQSGALKDLIEANRENRSTVLPMMEGLATDGKHLAIIYTAAIRDIAKDYINWIERDVGIDFSPEQYAQLIRVLQQGRGYPVL